MAQYSKRGRNRNNRRQGGNNNPNRSMDSQGPEVKIRGTAAQIYDKYQALARDAASAGDRIRAESLMQHAEHYYRLMKSMQPEKPAESKKDETAEAPTPEATSSDSNETKAADGEENAPAAAAAVSDEGASTAEESQEEAKPRRRRRRRRADESSESEASENGAAAAPAEALEEVAAE